MNGVVTAAVDATRCPIERPKGPQEDAKRFYSVKDSYYALKYELGVSMGEDTRIVYLSPAYRGGTPDIEIARQQLKPMLEPHEFVIMDKGYQDDREPQFLSPVKEGNTPLTLDDLEMNRKIYELRQIVERVNKRIKHFKAFEHRWRHGHGHVMHELCFTLACKLVNVSLEYEPMNA